MVNLNFNNIAKFTLFFAFLFGVFSGCGKNEILKPVEEKEAAANTEESVSDNSNGNPVILDIITDSDSVRMGKKLYLSVAAIDPEGDELSFSWESTSGEFSENSVNVVWTAPLGAPCCVPGPYLISVIAQDGKGGSDSGEIIVEVTL